MGVVAAFANLKPQDAPAWLAPSQQAGQALWRTSVWPGRKTESWRYTSLRSIEQGEYFAHSGSLDGVAVAELGGLFDVQGLAGPRLVFVNGCLCLSLSNLADVAGLNLVPFSEASSSQVETIVAQMGAVIDAKAHMFAALNAQLLHDGAFVHVSANAVVAEPVHVVHITTEAGQNFNVQGRLLLLAEQNAQVQLVEHFVSTDAPQNAFVNHITELYVGANAQVQHVRLNQEHASSIHIGGVHAKLERDARLNSFYLATGGELKRLDVVVDYFGEGASSEINGVYLPRGNEHVDFHTCIEHRVPHCTTQEVFRGIVGDSARAVFNGRIHIHPQAQKTLAQLSNKNLLTSTKAEVNTKPELEIYADDVQCAHGATVAQLDAMAMHYLRTRGISQEEAQVMLSFGFINELINKIPLTAVAEYLRPQLALYFARNPELSRHLI